MQTLTWDNRYQLGIPTVDAQHQKLFAVYNSLVTALRQNQSDAAVLEALREMVRYTGTHFCDEERFMLESFYPSFMAHRRQHSYFIQKTQVFLNEYEAEKNGLSETVCGFLKNWLVRHILEADREFAAYHSTHG